MCAAIALNDDDVLVVVDMQQDFCPGGNLPVHDGDEIVPLINRLGRRFQNVVLTQDWHPEGHLSFASSYPDKKPYETIEMPYGQQILWPDHCIQGTSGADFHDHLDIPTATLVIRKGFRPAIDSYSAFFENDRTTQTGLGGYLRERGLKRVFLAGLAFDFCVGYSAIDAVREGFAALVIEDACRAIDVDDSLAATRASFLAHGVACFKSDLLG
jgi:nicotinamidase/pyrazinamidase